MKILIINGANLNLLGIREVDQYGAQTLDEIITYTDVNKPNNYQLTWYQSNIEGEIVDQVQQAIGNYDALIINPGGYSHTSVVIHDALKCFSGPIIEVHISNVYKREEMRQTMLTAKAASTIMSGLGKNAYLNALLYLELLEKDK